VFPAEPEEKKLSFWRNIVCSTMKLSPVSLFVPLLRPSARQSESDKRSLGKSSRPPQIFLKALVERKEKA
jgi:hypothetical protein